MVAEQRLGMELNTPQRERFMAHCLDLPFVLRRRAPGNGHKLRGQRVGIAHEGVVSGNPQRSRYPFEDAPAVVPDGSSFTMHRAASPNGAATKCLAQTLVAETDPQHGNPTGTESTEGIDADTGFHGRTRPWRHHDALRNQLFDFAFGELVVADHDRVRAECAQVLDEVEGEGVVVVDHN